MLIIEIIFVMGTLLLLAYAIYKIAECDDREEELDKRQVALDERANKLSQWEMELTSWSRVKKDEWE